MGRASYLAVYTWLALVLLTLLCYGDQIQKNQVPAGSEEDTSPEVVLSPPVEVTGGSVVGSVEQSAGGRPYYAYRAVPYAGFREGEHRFQPPPPVEPWEGILTSTETGPYCAQGALGSIRGDEDCLHLSVYTPQMKADSALLPVLVWLHGGAFVVSGAGDYDPRLIMDRNVVLVIPQYRLGMLGFLYAHSDAPGNYGLLDQAAALRWVRDNVAQFGGDPTRVTLGGDDAGGASALYHMLSPQSQGLFHAVISATGSPLSPWAKHPPHRRNMLILAQYLKCPRAAMSEMMQCYSELPLHTLLEAQTYLLEARDLFTGNGGLAPTVQKQSVRTEEGQVLEEEPLVSFAEGNFAKVPVLLMVSKDVGNYVVDMSLYEWMEYKSGEDGDSFKDDMIGIILQELGVPSGGEEEDFVWDQYLPGLRGTHYDEKLEGVGQIMADALYNAGLCHTARYLNNKVPTWLMRFDFEAGPHSFEKRHPDPSLAPPIPPGAGHGDELHYFLPERFEPFVSSDQQRVSRIMLDTIDNFVNGRPPAPHWPLFTDDGLDCAILTADASLTSGRFLEPGRQRGAEMFFREQHKYHLSKLEEKRQTRDEL